MNFKHWLVLSEISDVVYAKDLNQNKILLYHGTSTGENDERIESFKKHGALPIGIGHGQGGGFFVSTKLNKTKEHALTLTGSNKSSNIDTGITHTGKPMVVVIELDSIDFKEWDFDAETMGNHLLKKAAKMLDKKPEKTFKGTLSDKTLDYFRKDKNEMPKDVQVKKFPSIGTIRFDISKGTDALAYPGGKYYDPEQRTGISDAKKISAMYQLHQDKSGGRHEKIEAAAFKKLFLNGKYTVDIKYTGSKPLPVKEILVFDEQKKIWENA